MKLRSDADAQESRTQESVWILAVLGLFAAAVMAAMLTYDSSGVGRYAETGIPAEIRAERFGPDGTHYFVVTPARARDVAAEAADPKG